LVLYRCLRVGIVLALGTGTVRWSYAGVLLAELRRRPPIPLGVVTLSSECVDFSVPPRSECGFLFGRAWTSLF